MKKMSLQQKSNLDMAQRVLLFKRTLKQWFYFAGLKYLQVRSLSEGQEIVLEDFTDFAVELIDKVDTEEFFKKKESDSVRMIKIR